MLNNWRESRYIAVFSYWKWNNTDLFFFPITEWCFSPFKDVHTNIFGSSLMKSYFWGLSNFAGINRSPKKKSLGSSSHFLTLVTITAHAVIHTGTPPGLICSPQTSGSYLLVVRSQYDPPTEGVAEVDHAGTAAETQHFGEGCFHG